MTKTLMVRLMFNGKTNLETKVASALSMIHNSAVTHCLIKKNGQWVGVDANSTVKSVQEDLDKLSVTTEKIGGWLYIKCGGYTFQANQSAFRERWRAWLCVPGVNGGLKKGPLAIKEQLFGTSELRNEILAIVFTNGRKTLGHEDLSKHIKSKLAVNIFDKTIFGE
jgi:hypothetical protein